MSITDELIHLDPATLVIGTNVRTDLHPDARKFAASIKARGVLEVITAYRDEDGQVVVLRGQRRAVVAAQVGTPTGTVPVRLVPAPQEADRIVDQLGENLHREAMHDREVREGVQQLALAGVSAAQIAKRTAIPRPTVNAVLVVANSEATRARLDAGELTLEQAAIFAEFEHDEEATERLTRALRWRESLEHVAQKLRDEAAEAAALAAEVERLRGEGLPVLDPADAPAPYRLFLSDLLTTEGEPVPEQDWPNVPGAAVVMIQEGTHPDSGDADTVDEADDALVWVPAWVCTDPEAAGLHYRHDRRADTTSATDEDDEATRAAEERDEATREAVRQERRTVIANNKAWASAETVRRAWLATFLQRKPPPKGAEALICEAVLTGHHSLTTAMQHRHPRLLSLLGIESTDAYYGAAAERDRLIEKATTPKAATMLTLACVLAAWEDSTGKHTWRGSTRWDARVMGALTEWGYLPSDVEALLTASRTVDTAPDCDVDAA